MAATDGQVELAKVDVDANPNIAQAFRVQSIPAVFAISDVIGDDPSVIGSGPCSPEPLDETAFLALLDAHELRSSLEREMAQFLGRAQS